MGILLGWGQGEADLTLLNAGATPLVLISIPNAAFLLMEEKGDPDA